MRITSYTLCTLALYTCALTATLTVEQNLSYLAQSLKQLQSVLPPAPAELTATQKLIALSDTLRAPIISNDNPFGTTAITKTAGWVANMRLLGTKTTRNSSGHVTPSEPQTIHAFVSNLIKTFPNITSPHTAAIMLALLSSDPTAIPQAMHKMDELKWPDTEKHTVIKQIYEYSIASLQESCESTATYKGFCDDLTTALQVPLLLKPVLIVAYQKPKTDTEAQSLITLAESLQQKLLALLQTKSSQFTAILQHCKINLTAQNYEDSVKIETHSYSRTDSTRALPYHPFVFDIATIASAIKKYDAITTKDSNAIIHKALLLSTIITSIQAISTALESTSGCQTSIAMELDGLFAGRKPGVIYRSPKTGESPDIKAFGPTTGLHFINLPSIPSYETAVSQLNENLQVIRDLITKLITQEPAYASLQKSITLLNTTIAQATAEKDQASFRKNLATEEEIAL